MFSNTVTMIFDNIFWYVKFRGFKKKINIAEIRKVDDKRISTLKHIAYIIYPIEIHEDVKFEKKYLITGIYFFSQSILKYCKILILREIDHKVYYEWF